MSTAQRTEQHLLSRLDELIGEYQELLDVTKAKQSAIQDNEYEELEVLTEKQQALAGHIEELKRTIQSLLGDRLPDNEDVTLESIGEKSSGDAREKLSTRKVELKQVIRDVQRFTRENMRLMESRMSVFHELYEELGDSPSNETYDKNSKKDEQQRDEAVLIDEAI